MTTAAKTPLFDSHQKAGGKLVNFSGWQLPVYYGSLVDEHHSVRRASGVFDVSHMTVVDLAGPAASTFLAYLLANNPATRLLPGGAMYSCMLNEQGGIIDDLIVYQFDDTRFRLIVNAATRERDLQWINAQASGHQLSIDERTDLALLAVQGPKARDICLSVATPAVAQMAAGLGRFQAAQCDDWFVARTGYTGEDGFEIALPAAQAGKLWTALLNAGVAPCGLGARDTLRLEAGMNLYGTDMDESQTPLTSGLGWTLGWEPDDRDFCGRQALELQRRDGAPQRLTGLILNGKGVLRSGQLLLSAEREVGTITSGTFSPTLQQSIAFARIAADHKQADLEVQIRSRRLPVTEVSRTFVRNGQAASGNA